MADESTSSAPGSGKPVPTLAELALALAKMRDSLVNLSLCLQDCRFEDDVVNREQAQHQMNELLKKASSLSR